MTLTRIDTQLVVHAQVLVDIPIPSAPAYRLYVTANVQGERPAEEGGHSPAVIGLSPPFSHSQASPAQITISVMPRPEGEPLGEEEERVRKLNPFCGPGKPVARLAFDISS